MISLATAIQKTGASDLITGGLIGSLGAYGPYAVLGGIMAVTSLLMMFMSNTATAVLFMPIAVQAAEALGVRPEPYVMGVAAAASLCLASPFSTPPNAMVMSAGRYSFMDYIRVGLPLQLLYILLLIFVLPLLFSF